MEEFATGARPTKIAVVLRKGLESWQALNVTAFLVSGIAATSDAVGEPYLDASGNRYLPMFGQPVMVFSANHIEIKTVADRVKARNVASSVYTDDLFATGNDVDNRAAVEAIEHEDLKLAGLAFRADRNVADKILKGLKLYS